MPFAKAIFNKKKKFHWYNGDDSLVLFLNKRDLSQKWFIADFFYPEVPDYNAGIHKQEILKLLSAPDDLVEFKISNEVKQQVLELRGSA